MMSDLIKEASQHLTDGNVLLYPTDTVWGVGCDACNFEAVAKVFQLKKRAESKSPNCFGEFYFYVKKICDCSSTCDRTS